MEELMDLMVTGESGSEVSDKIKELLYAKAAERVENLKPNASAGLFDNEEGEDTIDTETEEEE
jgi:hypothetical protein